MELIEIEQERRMRREEAAAWLRALADNLARHNEVEFVRDGITYRVEVPDDVMMNVEIEIGDDNEIEVEISW